MFWRGRVLLYSEQEKTAKKNIQFALQNDPDNKTYSNFWKNMKLMDKKKEAGDAALRDNHCSVAVALYEECLQIDPLNANY